MIHYSVDSTPFLSTYPKDSRDACSAVLRIIKTWKQLKCSSTDDVYIAVHYSGIKKNKRARFSSNSGTLMSIL